MNKYELALVVSAKIDDDARAAVVDKAKAIIEKAGGTITDIDEKGKLRLAYEIQKMREGYYYFIHFDASVEAPAQIEANVRIMESVLRYLCVRQDAE
ncbi:MAG: 30S ribosomal protein S6 [Wujia sp.]